MSANLSESASYPLLPRAEALVIGPNEVEQIALDVRAQLEWVQNTRIPLIGNLGRKINERLEKLDQFLAESGLANSPRIKAIVTERVWSLISGESVESFEAVDADFERKVARATDLLLQEFLYIKEGGSLKGLKRAAFRKLFESKLTAIARDLEAKGFSHAELRAIAERVFLGMDGGE